MQPGNRKNRKNVKLSFGDTFTNKVRQSITHNKSPVENLKDLMVKNCIYHEGPEGGIQLITKDSSIIQLIEKARKIEK